MRKTSLAVSINMTWIHIRLDHSVRKKNPRTQGPGPYLQRNRPTFTVAVASIRNSRPDAAGDQKQGGLCENTTKIICIYT